jgi:hypothetical protein
MIDNLIIPVLVAFFSALITWLFSRAKNKRDLKAQDIENEIKAAKYYQGLLDDLAERLDKAITELKESEERHDKLMEVNRKLVDELQKFKQLNGKSK